MEAEGRRRRGAAGLWHTRGRSQDRVSVGEAGGSRFWRMEWRGAGVVDAAGVAGGEMGEDSLDDLGRLDTRDDAQRSATHTTVFDSPCFSSASLSASFSGLPTSGIAMASFGASSRDTGRLPPGNWLTPAAPGSRIRPVSG